MTRLVRGVEKEKTYCSKSSAKMPSPDSSPGWTSKASDHLRIEVQDRFAFRVLRLHSSAHHRSAPSLPNTPSTTHRRFTPVSVHFGPSWFRSFSMLSHFGPSVFNLSLVSVLISSTLILHSIVERERNNSAKKQVYTASRQGTEREKKVSHWCSLLG